MTHTDYSNCTYYNCIMAGIYQPQVIRAIQETINPPHLTIKHVITLINLMKSNGSYKEVLRWVKSKQIAEEQLI